MSTANPEKERTAEQKRRLDDLRKRLKAAHQRASRKVKRTFAKSKDHDVKTKRTSTKSKARRNVKSYAFGFVGGFAAKRAAKRNASHDRKDTFRNRVARTTANVLSWTSGMAARVVSAIVGAVCWTLDKVTKLASMLVRDGMKIAAVFITYLLNPMMLLIIAGLAVVIAACSVAIMLLIASGLPMVLVILGIVVIMAFDVWAGHELGRLFYDVHFEDNKVTLWWNRVVGTRLEKAAAFVASVIVWIIKVPSTVVNWVGEKVIRGVTALVEFFHIYVIAPIDWVHRREATQMDLRTYREETKRDRGHKWNEVHQQTFEEKFPDGNPDLDAYFNEKYADLEDEDLDEEDYVHPFPTEEEKEANRARKEEEARAAYLEGLADADGQLAEYLCQVETEHTLGTRSYYMGRAQMLIAFYDDPRSLLQWGVLYRKFRNETEDPKAYVWGKVHKGFKDEAERLREEDLVSH